MLQVKNIHTYYGSSHILFGLSLAVGRGEIVGLLGRNGVGKTTTLRSIIGLNPPRSGTIEFDGHDVTGKTPYFLSRSGVGFVPEDRRVFPNLTVEENLEVAMPRAHHPRVWTIDKAYELFPQLRTLRDRKGGYLSGGEQQMLTIARTLMINPKLILLDEPMEGLAPAIVSMLVKQIRGLKDQGMTILLSEQNVKAAIKVVERCYVIETGRVKFEGTTVQLMDNENARKRYLGV
jgi:branched-chain amino acid transport system ATP-binding protein